MSGEITISCDDLFCDCSDRRCLRFHYKAGNVHPCGKISCVYNFPVEFFALAKKCHTKRCTSSGDCTGAAHRKQYAHSKKCVHGFRQGLHSDCPFMYYYVVIKLATQRLIGIGTVLPCDRRHCDRVYLVADNVISSVSAFRVYRCPFDHDGDCRDYLPVIDMDIKELKDRLYCGSNREIDRMEWLKVYGYFSSKYYTSIRFELPDDHTIKHIRLKNATFKANLVRDDEVSLDFI